MHGETQSQVHFLIILCENAVRSVVKKLKHSIIA